MNKEFVMRGQTASGKTEILNFSGHKPGYAYRMTEFSLYESTLSPAATMLGSVTAGKTAVSPDDINFNNEGLIASSVVSYNPGALDGEITHTIINDTFLITQNLILMVLNTVSGQAINWQCRFVAEKMSKSEEAVTNYKQYTISDE